MKRIIFSILFLALFFNISAIAQTADSSSSTPKQEQIKENKPQKFTIKDQGLERVYYLYLPENLQEGAPLVFLLHGYGGKAENYCPSMIPIAEKNGFVLCYPEGSATDSKGKRSWNVGYPSQQNMKVCDIKFLDKLIKVFQKKYKVSKDNIFCTGMSNGGEMCYMLAYERPDTYKAVAPIAGLTLTWMLNELKPKGTMPLMEVHGTADKTSKWEGDPTNQGGWGEYIAVPLAVTNWASINKCTHMAQEILPLKDPEKPSREVVLHKYLGGQDGAEVWLYEVKEGGHTWSLDDMNTTELIWEFFSKYLQ